MLRPCCAALAAALLCAPALAQSPPADKLIQACEQQRNSALNGQAIALATNAALGEEIARLKAEIEKLKAAAGKK